MSKCSCSHRHIVVLLGLLAWASCSKKPGPYLKAAINTERWLQSVSIQTNYGKVWPADASDSTSVVTNLYSGTPGVILFYIELYHTIQNPSYLHEARLGADHLMAVLPDSLATPGMAGLYTGIAGIGFTLHQAYKSTGHAPYLDGARHCVRILHDATIVGDDASWSPVTDIISGNTGVGLFLLYAADFMGDTLSLDLAVKTGRWLVKQAIPVENGLKWPMAPDYPRFMPNFSHGTAGICYFLTELYIETGETLFLNTAMKGAEYLLAITTEDGFIFHHEPDGKDLYYLGWCHGPVGTARLYDRLLQVTGNVRWLEAIKKGAASIMRTGIPETRVQGFWNNVGVCCGSAGVAEYYLNLYRLTQDETYLAFAYRLTDDLLQRATSEETGMRWIQAEHRARPELLQAQTGLMQGAAGIGLWLLHLDAFETDRMPLIMLPDTPFGPIHPGWNAP